MMSTAGKLSKKLQHEATVNRLLEQFRPVVSAALNNGYDLGVADTKRQLAEQLAGVELPAVLKKRDKTTKGVVECPFPKCKNPGIKPNNCFCKEHFLSLSEKDKKKYRDEQIARRAEARKRASQTVSKEEKKAVG